MSLDTDQSAGEVLTRVEQLIVTLREAERGPGPLLVGLEHEKLLFPQGSVLPVAYEGPAGVRAVLEAFARHGYSEFREGPGLPPIAMVRGVETISLEPGGQLELSGSPFRSAREAHQENLRHLEDLKIVVGALGLRVVALGYRPFVGLDEMPWMPKTRYQVMRETLVSRGRLARAMMLMTATGQVSLDWRDEADCVKKVVASARISPLLVALFANSPIANGAVTGYQSWRSRVWNEVDPARCGYPQAMLDGSFSYRAYVEWAMDAPMLFLRRHGQYINPMATFRQLLEGGWEGERLTMSDWTDHLSTLFPEVRLKKIIEIRSADGNDPAMTGALAALMRGLLYEPTALDEVSRVVPPLSPRAHLELHAAAQVSGLAARLGAGTLADHARELVGVARRGLERLDPLDVPLLEPLEEIARSGRSRATGVLERFEAEKDPAAFLGAFEI